MSFAENPYKHMDVMVDEQNHVTLRCDGCGAEALGVYTLDTPVRELRRRMDSHINGSHRLAPSDFEGWG